MQLYLTVSKAVGCVFFVTAVNQLMPFGIMSKWKGLKGHHHCISCKPEHCTLSFLHAPLRIQSI